MSNMPLVYVAAFLLAASLIVLGLGVCLPWLKKERQGYPFEDKMEAILLPYLYEACLGASKASEALVDEMKVRLDGVDKKKIADLAYDMLPASIVGIPVGLIKMFVTREKWSLLVQDAYDHFTASYQANRQAYEEALDQWKQEYNAPLPEEPRKSDPQ